MGKKQSTADKFLSHAVAKFFDQKRYMNEAAYVRTIALWHESTDGRGPTQEERKKANLDMLNMLLDEWMPWHRENGFVFVSLIVYQFTQLWQRIQHTRTIFRTRPLRVSTVS